MGIQEVVGCAIALRILSGGRLPLWAGVLITATDSFAFLLLERLGTRFLEAMFAGMVAVMVVMFGAVHGVAGSNAGDIALGFLWPRASGDAILEVGCAMVHYGDT